jgi:hypothetical protein
MKKILLIILVLTNSFLNAQDNWNNIIPNGFNSGTVGFDGIKAFNNKLYIIGDSGYNINYTYYYSKIFLYSSSTGAGPGTYTLEAGLNTVLQDSSENKISSMVSNNNFLFFGSSISNQNSQLTPQVYRYDKTTYKKHGFIDYSTLPVNNAICTGGYSAPYLANMVLFSPTGSNDTVYAFLNPGYNANAAIYSNISVWKAPAATTGTLSPTWVNTTNFTTASGVTSTYDAIVWNKKLYLAVNSTSRGGMILRTSNGVDWDTVLVAASKGTNYISGNFTALEIYKGKLVAAFAKSSSSPDTALWYTSDSIAASSAQQWGPLTGSSFVNITSNWSGINDLLTANGKLWIQVINSSTPMIYDYSEHGTDTTIFQSSGGTGFETYTNQASSFELESFHNAVYSSGLNMGVAQRLSNPNTNHSAPQGSAQGSFGTTWMFNPVNPVAAFKDSVPAGAGTCVNNNVYVVSTSTNASSYNWYVNGNFMSTNSVLSYQPENAGTDTIKLVAYNGQNGYDGNALSQFRDSVTHLITIHANPTVISASASSSVVCQGQLDTLKATVNGGVAPYTYAWYDHYGSGQYGITLYNTGTDSNAVIPFDTIPTQYYHYMYVTVTDANHCSGGSTLFPVYVNPADSLSGLITDQGNNLIGAGKVYLFKQKISQVGVLDTTGIYTLDASGKYTFPSLYYGNYYLKAVPDSFTYKKDIGTYYSTKLNAYQWNLADTIKHYTCHAGNDKANIQVLTISTPTTTPVAHGIITGTITSQPGSGFRLANGSLNQVDGAPLKGIDVKLGKNPGGGCTARTTSDSTGYYSFTNVDTGSYHIFVDIPNYGMDSVRAVNVTKQDTVSINNNYYVDSTMIRVLSTNVLIIAICKGDTFKVGTYYHDTAGVFYDTLKTPNLRDSLVITKLSIKALPHVTIVSSADSICAGSAVILTGRGAGTYTWNSVGTIDSTITDKPATTTIYTVTGTTNGCSRSASISIKVNQLPIVTISANKDSTCTSNPVILTGSGANTYTWNYGVNTVSVTVTPTLTATYSLTGTDVKNCTNATAKTIKVNPYSDKGVTLDVMPSGAIVLMSNAASSATYQWIDCNNHDVSINGATGQSYTATITGNYAVILTAKGCQDTSVCNLATITTGIASFTSGNLINIYPNPSNGIFTIETNSLAKQTLQMFDVNGKLVLNQDMLNGKATIDAATLPDGIYNVSISGNSSIINKRLIITR